MLVWGRKQHIGKLDKFYGTFWLRGNFVTGIRIIENDNYYVKSLYGVIQNYCPQITAAPKFYYHSYTQVVEIITATV